MTTDDTIAAAATQDGARSSVCAGRQNAASGRTLTPGPAHGFERLGAVDHPWNTEAIGTHAEAPRPEGFLERHGYGVRQGLEDTLRLGRVLDGRHHVEPLGRLVAVRWGVATQQKLLSEIEPRVDDLVAHTRGSVLCAR